MNISTRTQHEHKHTYTTWTAKRCAYVFEIRKLRSQMGKSWKCGSKRATYAASEPQPSHNRTTTEPQPNHNRTTKSRKHLASLAATTLVNWFYHQVYHSQNEKVPYETHPLTRLGISIKPSVIYLMYLKNLKVYRVSKKRN